MLLKEIIGYLESRAHPSLQENYDNSGLITGNTGMDITGAIVCLDSTPEVIAEARRKGCNLVIAHHPILFSGLKKLNGKNYIERTVIEAIKNDIAIYAIHTNLDNVAQGVNAKIAERIGLKDTRVLDPKGGLLQKLVVFCPVADAVKIRQAMFDAGAGHIGDYDECSFNTTGEGSFRAGEGTHPHVGEIGKTHVEQEVRVEVIIPVFRSTAVIAAMKKVHPYEEVAFDLYNLNNDWNNTGSGMIGELPAALPPMEFLQLLKTNMKASSVRHTAIVKDTIKTVAVCGGSGSFLLGKAIASGADAYVTADFKYHQFFDADGHIIVADIGHYESEQFTMELLNDWLRQKFPTFATHLTEVITNPVHYL